MHSIHSLHLVCTILLSLQPFLIDFAFPSQQMLYSVRVLSAVPFNASCFGCYTFFSNSTMCGLCCSSTTLAVRMLCFNFRFELGMVLRMDEGADGCPSWKGVWSSSASLMGCQSASYQTPPPSTTSLPLCHQIQCHTNIRTSHTARHPICIICEVCINSCTFNHTVLLFSVFILTHYTLHSHTSRQI